MITGVAFCPQAPALVPEVGRGLDLELAAVRAATRAAIGRAVVGAQRIVLLAAADAGAPGAVLDIDDRQLDDRSVQQALARWGAAPAGPAVDPSAVPPALPDSSVLPDSLVVGSLLVRDALASVDAPADVPSTVAVAVAAEADAARELRRLLSDDLPTAVVVVGDASARRTEKAPGYLDERATGFDARVAAALAAGRPELLAELSRTPGEAQELLAAGAPAWAALALALEPDGAAPAQPFTADLLVDDAPFGVGYLVAVWTPSDLSSDPSSVTRPAA